MQNFIFRVIRKTSGETDATIIVSAYTQKEAYNQAVGMIATAIFKIEDW